MAKQVEEWKDIKGYEGFYQISSFGRVQSVAVRRSLHGKIHVIKRTHIMTPFDNSHGYLAVNLKTNNKRKLAYVHRLVAEAFVPKPDGCNIVNHIDFNKKNNNVNNLEWCTQKDNIHHSKERMSKPRKGTTNKTGEKYISKTKQNTYRLCMKVSNIEKTFKTLQEAIEYREKIKCENESYYGKKVV